MKNFRGLAFVIVLTLSAVGQERPGRIDRSSVLLPNRWRLSPAGKSVGLGDFPLNMAMTPDGRYLAVNHNGQSRQFVAIVELQTNRKVSEVTVDKSFYGICFSPDGRTLYVSGAGDNWIYAYDFKSGFLGNERHIVIGEQSAQIFPAGIAVSAGGRYLYTANNLSNTVSVVNLATSLVVKTIALGPETSPYAVQPSRNGRELYVTLWGKSGVAVVDLRTGKVNAVIPVGDHPNAMELSRDGKALFVANANSNTVSMIDVPSRKAVVSISTALHPRSLEGSTPNALALSPDGKTLLVANADNNDVSIVNIENLEEARVSGFIPTGWYPTAVRFSKEGNKIYVANGKGTASFANPQGPSPFLPRDENTQFIAQLMRGSLSVIDLPGQETLKMYTQQVYSNSPYLPDDQVTMKAANPNPIPAAVGGASPIKHVVYIVKENRTYDQIFGDIREGNGDPQLCLFPERVTPNHHALAREFVLLDNFYVESEVSADGHNWSMGAYATDYVEKIWPQNYSGRKRAYDFEGESAIASPSMGYIWDQAKRANITYRSYGEFVTNGETPREPARARVKALEGHIDPMFRSFDLSYRDVDRANRFIQELKGFENSGQMPQLIIVRLPNDHTDGTKPNSHSPTAMVADNDLALGMVVQAISQSRFWKDTAIFVVEDDAQNGSDHVDAHRTAALVISPYTKRGVVDNTMYGTVSMLRTIELILGLQPMSQFDAAAFPMYNSFTMDANFTPYAHKAANVNLNEINSASAWGARRSMEMNFKKEDAAPDLELNEIIWKSVRGADSPMPPPVHAAFVRVLKEKEDRR